MPTIEQNKQKWDGTYHWQTGGDKWSEPWGSVEMQWHAGILPRIHAFVPSGSILEIAPGFGRWTSYLKDLCQQLTVVDLSQKCIDACRERFQDCSHISYHVNDGQSLAAVPDGSIDFVFSFDSLVHVEDQAVEAYLDQLGRKLKKDGVGFIHHSNTGQYAKYFAAVRAVPPIRLLLRGLGFETSTHSRALSMTAEKFERFAAESDLQCISQEMINWRSPLLIDCMSVFTRKGSVWARDNNIMRNHNFMHEARLISRLSTLYRTSRHAA